MRNAFRVWLMAGPALIAGCNAVGIGNDVVCTANIVPGVVVRITDGQSGAPLAEGAVAYVKQGSYAEQLRPGRWEQIGTAMVLVALQGADEKAGTFRIEVARPGYAPAALDGVVVTGGTCHVTTRNVDIKLSALP